MNGGGFGACSKGLDRLRLGVVLQFCVKCYVLVSLGRLEVGAFRFVVEFVFCLK